MRASWYISTCQFIQDIFLMRISIKMLNGHPKHSDWPFPSSKSNLQHFTNCSPWWKSFLLACLFFLVPNGTMSVENSGHTSNYLLINGYWQVCANAQIVCKRQRKKKGRLLTLLHCYTQFHLSISSISQDCGQ